MGTHLFRTHGVTADEYRERLGLDKCTSLISESVQRKKRLGALRSPTYKANLLKKGAKYRFVSGDKRAGKYIRSEQTMERIKKLSIFR